MIADPFVLGVAATFGLLAGSFLNVCIVRFPRDPDDPADPAAKLPATVVNSRSMCPRCGTMIAWYDNIPILSWVVLGAKCRHCRAPISAQYPLVELAVAGLWVAAVRQYGITATAVAAGVFGSILLGIMVTDARHYIIPDEFMQGGLALGLALSLRYGFGGLGDAAVGAAVGFALLYIVAVAGEKVFGEEAMGGGDIKMMAMVGAFVGWKGVLLTVFGGAFLATAAFLPLSLLVRFKRSSKGRSELPYGVFLAIAAGAVFVVGETIAHWYMNFLRAG
ncbi:MAG: prepilin peptidase [Gemmatimonadetes bacterium]|nr:prepilin peptidase [Gemmatimonadota bacterium]